VSYLAYKLIHFSGIFILLTAVATRAASYVTTDPLRRLLAPNLLSWIASAFILVGGFGMLARLGMLQTGPPPWAMVKLGILMAILGLLLVVRRSRDWARYVAIVVPLLAIAAAAIVLFKPR
jgi:hypothetical protein